MAKGATIEAEADPRDVKLSKKAKRIYKKLFGRPLHPRFQLLWHVDGLTDNHCGYLTFSRGMKSKEELDTVVHELLHVWLVEEGIKQDHHGPLFDAMVKMLMKKARKVK